MGTRGNDPDGLGHVRACALCGSWRRLFSSGGYGIGPLGSEPTLQSREAWLPTCLGFPASKMQVSPGGATWGLSWVGASGSP